MSLKQNLLLSLIALPSETFDRKISSAALLEPLSDSCGSPNSQETHLLRGIRPAETAGAKTTLAMINAATGARFTLAFVLAPLFQLFYINKDPGKNCK